MAQNSRSRSDRPAKPYPEFPLFPHATRRWAKKILGKFVFFGPWDNPHGALQRYLAQRDELHAGRNPAREHSAAKRSPPARARPSAPRQNVVDTDESTNVLNPETGGATPRSSPSRRPAASTAIDTDGQPSVRDLVNHFLTTKKRRLEAEEMGLRSFSEYHATAGRLVKFFGKDRLVSDLAPDDFSRLRAVLAKARGPLSLGNEVGRVRSIFKHGYEAGVLDRPMRFGPDFSKPGKRAVRLARRAAGVRMFEPAEIKALLEAASPQMRAMILLGLNCGLGNTDVAELPRSAVDLKAGMLEFPRPKTGINRKAALWPETIDALRAVENQNRVRT